MPKVPSLWDTVCVSIPVVPSLWDTAYISVCLCVSMPVVPSLWDTACICIDLPHDSANIRQQLTEAVCDYGRVMSHRPLQITSILERPAALLVQWAEV